MEKIKIRKTSYTMEEVADLIEKHQNELKKSTKASFWNGFGDGYLVGIFQCLVFILAGLLIWRGVR